VKPEDTPESESSCQYHSFSELAEDEYMKAKPKMEPGKRDKRWQWKNYV
jgi:hypothetical protein